MKRRCFSRHLKTTESFELEGICYAAVLCPLYPRKMTKCNSTNQTVDQKLPLLHPQNAAIQPGGSLFTRHISWKVPILLPDRHLIHRNSKFSCKCRVEVLSRLDFEVLGSCKLSCRSLSTRISRLIAVNVLEDSLKNLLTFIDPLEKSTLILLGALEAWIWWCLVPSEVN